MSAKKYEPSLDEGTISAIVGGYHQDVFSVLGLHERPSHVGLVLRALLPNAQSVKLIDSKTGRCLGELNQISSEGLFELPLARRKKRFGYFLEVVWEGQSHIEVDPYSFGELLTEQQHYLFSEGTDERAYKWMGAHPKTLGGVEGTHFVVWAPSASRVSVVGNFNYWDGRRHVMRRNLGSGLWDIFIPGVASGSNYKYEIIDAQGNRLPLKADPYGRGFQHPPQTASVVVNESNHQWGDQSWMDKRSETQSYDQPLSIYELHLGSWKRKPEEGNRYLSYVELAEELIPYVKSMGFTHIQTMPVSEFPFDGSWGYQPIGLFAPTIRFGTPDEFRYFIDCCHQEGIGVLIDWVPGHFPTDEHGLGQFDGTALYEHMDPKQGFHPDWNTLIFNYGRREVLTYLISNAFYWFDEFHIDGLRVDAVASMLYLDYSREAGQWVPNQYGGRENLEAIAMLQQVNSRVCFNFPGVLMIAEESTSFPGITQPVSAGGVGFHYKWNMGWMNDTLSYIEHDPIYRQYHQDQLTFGLMYAFSEKFVLPLSHDEVVHGKGSLINKMPGDEWQQFANLRSYLGFMWSHPGKKLLFMGAEFAQRSEWNHNQSLDWHLLDSHFHQGIQSFVTDLNQLLKEHPSLYQQDIDDMCFEWIQANNHEQSVLVWMRKAQDEEQLIVTLNMTPNLHEHYRFGVPDSVHLEEILNSDDLRYGGSGQGNSSLIYTDQVPADGFNSSVGILLAPLAVQFFKVI
ncbi:1,4-alpha-glucan branching protein GlgB [Maribrevibacterium harenarium]|uniref:1,4-alpha-glucan branching enzyme GlgB n=1 Tax=Maribrevibacterium harenarium TaxID=2589817 RepID=A0A501WI17_9GAMM|nr:1,4-alpha-glucan branching protein GlgB [Maribrevibacterium harenarium]TPE48000.1 1,4-alpha-glucan branching protein GlgB [Maribrevibacterium harenarium]